MAKPLCGRVRMFSTTSASILSSARLLLWFLVALVGPGGNQATKYNFPMLVFVDESGDPGMKLGAGSSDLFVLTAVLFQDRDEALRCDSVSRQSARR